MPVTELSDLHFISVNCYKNPERTLSPFTLGNSP